MPRSGRLRAYIKEFAESPRFEKISFIPPFLVLIVEIILIRHALSLDEGYVIVLTAILLIISIIEIFFVGGEIHEHYLRTNFDRVLTIRLDDYIFETKKKNVKHIVEGFIATYPNYSKNRNEIYHVVCQIMETHKEETWEKTLRPELKKVLRQNKKKNIREILEIFLKKHPKYKKNPEKVYHMASQMMDVPTKKLKIFNKKIK